MRHEECLCHMVWMCRKLLSILSAISSIFFLNLILLCIQGDLFAIQKQRNVSYDLILFLDIENINCTVSY